MGIFSAVGGLIGGAAGGGDAPEVMDFFEPEKVFGGLRAGGLRFIQKGNRLVARRTPRGRARERQLRRVVRGAQRTRSRLQGERRQLGALRQDLLGLRSEVRPGFGRLTDARVRAIERAESRALGNIEEEFRARNVLGASFAARELAGVTAEFGEREEEARAQAIIEEIGTTLGIDRELLNVSGESARNLAIQLQAINTRLTAQQTRIQTDLAEAGLAANIQQSVLDLARRFAFAQAGLEAQAAADRGSAFSNIFGLADQFVRVNPFEVNLGSTG